MRRTPRASSRGSTSDAAWWVFVEDTSSAIFVGEFNAPEVRLIPELADVVEPDVIVLPSYSKMGEYGAKRHKFENPDNPRELSEKVTQAVRDVKADGTEIWALPHPKRPNRWKADRYARRFIPSR